MMSSMHVSNKTGRARKAHQCRVCGEMINPGEECQIYKGVEDGVGFYSIHFHLGCWKYSRGWDDLDWESCAPGDVSRCEVAKAEEAKP